MQGKPSTRRAYGDGRLLTRPNRYGGETWIGQFRIDGRSTMRRVGLKKSKVHPDGLTPGRAERRFQEIREEAKAAASVARPQRRTVAEVGEDLLRDKRDSGRKPSAVESIDSILRMHIVPFFGVRPVDKIEANAQGNAPDVIGFLRELEAKGLSPKTRGNALGVLHSLIDHAIRRKWATGPNPVKEVAKPRNPNVDADIRFLEVEEVEALLRAVPDDALGRVERGLYLTAAMTGMRQGELVALRWRDVDWTAGRIRVRRNYVHGEFGTPKSKRSSRAVPLASRVGAELERLYQDSPYQGDDDLVFAHPATGGPYDRSRLLKRFKVALERAGVRPVRFHDLRHTFGTRMAAQGVPMRTLQEWMGHRDFATTLIYADFAPNQRQETAWVEEAFATEPAAALAAEQA